MVTSTWGADVVARVIDRDGGYTPGLVAVVARYEEWARRCGAHDEDGVSAAVDMIR